jgi:hypothetical protein
LLDIIHNKEVWSFSDFTLVSNVRWFDDNICSCAECKQHGHCSHVLSRRMAEGREIPNILPDDVKSPKFAQRKSDTKVRQKVTNDPKMRQKHCFVCSLSCSSEFNFVTHLAGRKHLSNAVVLYKQLDLPLGFKLRLVNCRAWVKLKETPANLGLKICS